MESTNPERRIPLGDHLDELRAHLIRSLVAVAFVTTICFFFQDAIMAVVVEPHRQAAAQVSQLRLEELGQRSDGERRQRLAKAVAELQRCTSEIGTAAVVGPESVVLARRYEAAWRQVQRALPPPVPISQLQFLRYPDAFFAYLKLCLMVGLFLASPYVLYELWHFVAEGLKASEQRYVWMVAPFSVGCFLAGLVFSYVVLLPTALSYLLGYGQPELFQAGITLDGYLSLFLWLNLGMALLFELPLVLVFGALIGVLDSQQLRAFRRYFLLVAVVIAAIITPTGDPVTLSIVTGPLLLLYEVGIICVRVIERRRVAEQGE